MKLTFRWYGEKDSIPLQYIREIPNMSGVVTAVYDVPVGEVWPKEDLAKLKKISESAGLEMEVIESIPVHEDIKLGRSLYRKLHRKRSPRRRSRSQSGLLQLHAGLRLAPHGYAPPKRRWLEFPFLFL